MDENQVKIRLKKLPQAGDHHLSSIHQQLQNSKSNGKPTATIIAINHHQNGYNSYNNGGHYAKNGQQQYHSKASNSYNSYNDADSDNYNQKGSFKKPAIKSTSNHNLNHHHHEHSKYNGSVGTPSVTPSTTASSPSPCSSPRLMVQTPPRSSSLIKSTSKSLSNLYKRHHQQELSSSPSSSSQRALNSVESGASDESKTKSSGILEEFELLQIELNFKSHKTFVYVCRCLANLYFTCTDLINGGRISSPRSNEWSLNRTGVPVLVFDSGETRSRPRRLVQIILAERGSGFPLWKDIIDNLSDYKSIASTFHTMYTSSDHRKMAGLSFDSNVCADEFLHQIELITSDPINIALTGPKGRKGRLSKSQERERKMMIKMASQRASQALKAKKVVKSEISAPCLFQHVTSVDISDFDKLFSVSSLMLPPPPAPLLASEDGITDLTTDNGNNSSSHVHVVGHGRHHQDHNERHQDNQIVNQRLSQLKVQDAPLNGHSSSSSGSSASPPPSSVSSSVSTIDFDSSPVPSPSLQLPIPVPPPMPPPAFNTNNLKVNGIMKKTSTKSSLPPNGQRM